LRLGWLRRLSRCFSFILKGHSQYSHEVFSKAYAKLKLYACRGRILISAFLTRAAIR
jgi:hypothetical protein